MIDYSEKRTIGIDLDDVLVNFNGSFYEYHNQLYGTQITFPQIHSFNVWEVCGGDQDQSRQRILDFYQTQQMGCLAPIEGSVQAVNRLKNQHSLLVITSRPTDIRAVTEVIVEKHFPNCFADICITGIFANEQPNSFTKAGFAKRMGCDFLIDDLVGNLSGCLEIGMEGVLFGRPWNKHLSALELARQGITRAENWQEIERIFLD